MRLGDLVKRDEMGRGQLKDLATLERELRGKDAAKLALEGFAAAPEPWRAMLLSAELPRVGFAKVYEAGRAGSKQMRAKLLVDGEAATLKSLSPSNGNQPSHPPVPATSPPHQQPREGRGRAEGGFAVAHGGHPFHATSSPTAAGRHGWGNTWGAGAGVSDDGSASSLGGGLVGPLTSLLASAFAGSLVRSLAGPTVRLVAGSRAAGVLGGKPVNGIADVRAGRSVSGPFARFIFGLADARAGSSASMSTGGLLDARAGGSIGGSVGGLSDARWRVRR
ncbi:unnamed protein product [Closterium sp. NIES-64]|nr:unnamed protein product [Closterium sp. NIES-64]